MQRREGARRGSIESDGWPATVMALPASVGRAEQQPAGSIDTLAPIPSSHGCVDRRLAHQRHPAVYARSTRSEGGAMTRTLAGVCSVCLVFAAVIALGAAAAQDRTAQP